MCIRDRIRYHDKLDLVLIELAEQSTVSGVFTQNAFCAAPVVIAKSHLSSHDPRIFIINTGNAITKCFPRASLRCTQNIFS